MPRVIHFEIPADKPERAVAFYEKVFGWSFNKWEGPTEYWLVETGPEKQPGINGGLTRRQQPSQTMANVVDVASVDETTQTVEKAGGKTVVPKMHVPGVGHIAYYADTEGNIFGVLQAE